MPNIHLNSGFGVLYLDVDYGKLFESFNNMKDLNYGIFIVDTSGNNILDVNRFEDKNKNMYMNYDEYKKKKNTNDLKDYAIVDSVGLIHSISLDDSIYSFIYGKDSLIVYLNNDWKCNIPYANIPL